MVYGDPGCYPKACIRAHQRAVREGPLRDSLTFSKVCLCQHNQHLTDTGEESGMELEISRKLCSCCRGSITTPVFCWNVLGSGGPLVDVVMPWNELVGLRRNVGLLTPAKGDGLLSRG